VFASMRTHIRKRLSAVRLRITGTSFATATELSVIALERRLP
jgi:hypothetical protein